MIDRYERNINYLRVSITDRCNLRCRYCMPEQGVETVSHNRIMRYEEILRLCCVFAQLDVRKLKITGGEPLVRHGAVDFIAAAKNIPGIEQVTLTTNGLLVPAVLQELVSAGIDGINFSLDTIDEKIYASITRGGDLHQVLSGIDAAYAVGIRPLKINSVLIRGENDDPLPIAALAKEREIEVRFIELMPIGLSDGKLPVPGEEVLSRLSLAFGQPAPYEESLGNGPARYYSFPGFVGRIGLIDAVSHGFCDRCNRLRLTANGWLKLCLNYDFGCDLLTPLRDGANDDQLKALILRAIEEKPEAHSFGKSAGGHRDDRNMNMIGG